MPEKQRLIAALLWLWVVVAMASYLYQFRSFVGPILRVLGLE